MDLPERAGDGHARDAEVGGEGPQGQRKNVVLQGGRCVFTARVRFYRTVDDPSFAVRWVNEFHQNPFVANPAVQSERPGRSRAGEEALVRVSFDNVLGAGRYELSVLLAHRGSGT